MPIVNTVDEPCKLIPWPDEKINKCITYLEQRNLTRATGGEVKLLSYHQFYMLLKELRMRRDKE